MIELKKDSTVYVLCPAYIKTGGPELLHQLVYSLNANRVNAKITYYNLDESNKDYTNDDFKKYITDYKLINEVEDLEKNVIVIPETNVELIKKFKQARTVIWWLSVDNYEIHHNYSLRKQKLGLKSAIKGKIKDILTGGNKDLFKAKYHLCQSYYAIDFLEKKEINNSIYLSDYINDSYLETKVDYSKKEDIVLYNPKKGFEFTEKIIEKTPEIKWIPIENMTTEQVKELLLKSKVYIDFGNHPGKDRFPRETAICGCCVITGTRGAAKFENDVPILKEFKFNDDDKNIDIIIEKIKSCLNNYENEICKFEKYRNFISSEKEKFNDDVKNIFQTIEM